MSSGSSGDENFKSFTLARGDHELLRSREASKPSLSVILEGKRKVAKLATEIGQSRLFKARDKALKQ